MSMDDVVRIHRSLPTLCTSKWNDRRIESPASVNYGVLDSISKIKFNVNGVAIKPRNDRLLAHKPCFQQFEYVPFLRIIASPWQIQNEKKLYYCSCSLLSAMCAAARQFATCMLWHGMWTTQCARAKWRAETGLFDYLDVFSADCRWYHLVMGFVAMSQKKLSFDNHICWLQAIKKCLNRPHVWQKKMKLLLLLRHSSLIYNQNQWRTNVD